MTASTAAGGWRLHRLFGLTVSSDFPFASVGDTCPADGL